MDGNMRQSKTLNHKVFDEKKYEMDFRFKPWESGEDPMSIHSIPCLLRYMESEEGKNCQIEAKFLEWNKADKTFKKGKTTNRETFLKLNKRNVDFKEADTFEMDIFDSTSSIGSVGEETIPLLGGPFSKNLYYLDFIKMANSGFFAYHNDPFVHRAVQLIKHFTLGRGYRIDCDDKKALALWEAFSQANDFDAQMESVAIELPINGEVMFYWLNAGQKNITYQIPKEEIPVALIPRIRLIDPSTIWEIVTYPEDITRVIFYQQVFPTQYQIYTAKNVPSTKFIYQQLPADQVDHYKINSFHNEKRGRSDIYAALGYSKRLRDCVNYAIIKDLKNSSWAIDTTVEGSQEDIESYMKAQIEMGTVPPAGSEFVHSDKIKRDYQTASGSSAADSNSFEWALSSFCSGVGIPVSYFGTHLQNSGTRASTIVSTEPVAKLFEDRQKLYERIILKTSSKLFKMFGIKAKLEVSFPEIITQDRSVKLKDLALAESEGWFNKKRCAEIAAKEFNVTDFDFDTEGATAEVIPTQEPTQDKPLSNSAITAPDRKDIRSQNV